MSQVFFNVTAGDKPLGKIVFKLYDDVVPGTCKKFRELATGNSYKGFIFDQYQEKFVRGSLSKSKFTDEKPKSKKDDKQGLLVIDKDTNGHRFIITTGKDAALSNKSVVIGEVVEGYEKVVQTIAKKYVDNTNSFKAEIKIVDSGISTG